MAQFDAPACVIVKHANPCGVAVAEDIGTAYERAYSTDPTSAFGGIIAFNRQLDSATATVASKRALISKNEGDVVDFMAPDGEKVYEVIEVRYE